uniref:Transcriptional regulator n=1 Tax=Caenorhabditis tropicalis TaxID=1561998 RepID=A0A1I7TIT0_9PELO
MSTLLYLYAMVGGVKKSFIPLLFQSDGSQGILLANKSLFSEDKAYIEKLLKIAKLQEISRNYRTDAMPRQ